MISPRYRDSRDKERHPIHERDARKTASGD